MSDHHPARRVSPVAWLLVWPIRAYQVCISRYTPATCRYYPCCSSYGITSLRVHGAAKGLLLTAWRLLRCNPWSSGGVDHVPPPGRWRPVEHDSAAEDVVISSHFHISRAGDAAASTRTIAAAGVADASASRRTAA